MSMCQYSIVMSFINQFSLLYVAIKTTIKKGSKDSSDTCVCLLFTHKMAFILFHIVGSFSDHLHYIVIQI